MRRLYKLTIVAAIACAVIALVIFLVHHSRINSEAAELATAGIVDRGHSIAIDGAGNLTGLSVENVQLRQDISVALRTGKLPRSAEITDLLAGRRMVLASGVRTELPLRLLAPVGTLALADRPVFRWRSAAGAIGFRVDIFDTGVKPVLSSPLITTTEWIASAPLSRRQTYRWTVTASYDFKNTTVPSAPDPQARFRIAGDDARSKLNQVQTLRSDLLLAVEAARLGLLDEASEALDRLQSANPGSRSVARLRSSLTE